MKLPELNRLLSYKHPDVLKLYRHNHPDNKMSADQAFNELLKYLWISRKHLLESQAQSCEDEKVGFGFCRTDKLMAPFEYFFPEPLKEIDDMWHEFILFTEDYTEFCIHYFGQYIHHKPVIPNNDPFEREFVEHKVQSLLEYIYDNLGEETLRTWYSSFLSEDMEQQKKPLVQV